MRRSLYMPFFYHAFTQTIPSAEIKGGCGALLPRFVGNTVEMFMYSMWIRDRARIWVAVYMISYRKCDLQRMCIIHVRIYMLDLFLGKPSMGCGYMPVSCSLMCSIFKTKRAYMYVYDIQQMKNTEQHKVSNDCHIFVSQIRI